MVATPTITTTKELGPAIRLAIQRSVQEFPEVNGPRYLGPQGETGYSDLMFLASANDWISPWGVAPSLRDRQLRIFYPTESIAKSAIGAMIARNMTFPWALDGPPLTVRRVQEMLNGANAGAGWLDFVGRFSMDLYTQDKGAFVETIRAANSPDAPVVSIANLDAARCYHTGDPMIPVIYVDRRGRYHELKYYQVLTFRELPAPHEYLYGLQYSALTRVLEAAKIFRDIQTYTSEKLSGRRARAVHIVGGVAMDRIKAAILGMEQEADNANVTRFVRTPIVTSIDPKSAPTVDTLDLAGVPDGFDPEKALRQYITILALGLFVDYQDLAPLPGGGLGSSQQSEILDEKAKGKGPGLFMRLMEAGFNNAGVIPRNCTWRFDEIDVREEKQQAEVSEKRAKVRGQMKQNGEINDHGARQLALDSGDLPQELFDEMELAQVEAPRPPSALELAQARAGVAASTAPGTDGNERVEGEDGANGNASDVTMQGARSATGEVLEDLEDRLQGRAGPDVEERRKLEEKVAGPLAVALAKTYAEVDRFVRE